MKDFTVKETAGFRLRVTQKPCLLPKGLHSLDFIQEIKDDEGQVTMSSTYNFFLTDSEIDTLVQGLKS